MTVNAPPAVTFDFEGPSPLAGQQVDFSSKLSDPEEDPASLAWTFGDAEAPIGAAPSRAVKDPGRYTVTVTATDSNRATLVRLPKCEHRLRAGIQLKPFVRQTDRIGKYTRFLIPRGAPPKRLDLCLRPGRTTPGRCP